MVTLSILIAFIGFYVLYSTSKRAKLVLESDYQKWINQNPKNGQFIGLSLLILSLIVSLFSLGIGAGFFSFLVVVMTIASLVVLVTPLRFFNLSTLIIIAIICFGVEFLMS